MLVPHLYCVDPPWTVPHYTLKVQWAYSLVSGFELEIIISVHLCWLLTCTCKVFPSFLHESVSSIFLLQNCCSELTNTYCHTQKQKNKKWKLNHNNILLFLYRFFYLAWSGKDHWHHVRRSWERYSEFRWILI